MGMKLLPIFLFCILSSFSTAFGQQVEVVQGEVMVQMLPGHNGSEVADQLRESFGPASQVRSVRLVSRPLNVYLIRFDDSVLPNAQALDAAWQHSAVTTVQFNHVLSERATLPNDVQFAQQWQYINNGQNGGTVGADIDADLAWDITTGGLTALGDTIVACIIDDGLDDTHQDFGDNVWVNYNEIPNNNIDDDGNGYVDDRRGWDAYNNTDNIYQGGGHGTPVAGIVGAQGNNGTGVAGVNWDVKLMIVRGGGNEAEALAAYSYPLEMRKLYNQTNGQQGAFVVTTNASWGVDFGQPSQAPLWCAMYDSLGKYGIMSCGATANIGIDIDQQGDLPTACPSDYLISVTNMNRNDQKVNSAGWGLNTIDLGAFGADTWTTASGNGYGGFGGTSGATPHVTGAVALLYSAPCVNYASLAKTHPDSAARLAKDWILNGVDANSSLNNITVTGGRLNLHKALLQQATWDCNGNGCFTAYGLGATSTTDSTATIFWNTPAAADSFNVQFRPVGAANWATFTTTASTQAFDTLQACTLYEFRVETLCDTTNATYTSVFQFKTDGCCEAPTGISSTVSVTTATISFDSVYAATGYNLRYRVVGAPAWNNVTGLTAPNTVLPGLDSCANYEYQIQTVCDTGFTPYSATQNFLTGGCVGCEQTYCDAYSDDASDEWITLVNVSNLYNASLGSPTGYEDFTGQFSAALNRDTTYDIVLTPGYSNFTFNEVFQVFIDWNQDGDFLDLGEVVYTSQPTQGSVTGSVSVPANASLGATRMRIVMRYDQAGGSCDQGYDYGEVEDYCAYVYPAGFVSNDRGLENGLTVFPNPFSSEFNMDFHLPFSADVHARLFDMAGRQVRDIPFGTLTGGQHRLAFPADGLGEGMYFLDLQLGEEHLFEKLTLIK